MIDSLDRTRMDRALELAAQAIGVSDPNPRVGCVVAAANGSVVAEGFTQEVGGPHAEAMALSQAARNARSLVGGTAWVSLEPCAHHGRTPPCCDALIAAGLARVVMAIEDPFPLVAGAGRQRLLQSGVQVEVLALDDPQALEARSLNIGFLHRMAHGLPWVRLKAAASLDGRTALPDGSSRWITGEAARLDGHRFRRRASAIVSGIGTVLADRPRLDVRLVETRLQPLRVVVDSTLRLPPDAPILLPPGRCLVATVAPEPMRRRALEAAGAEVMVCAADSQGRVDLLDMLRRLAERQCNEVHVEAGATLNGAFVTARWVDELLLYVAPRLIGAGRGIADFGPIDSLASDRDFDLISADMVGADLRIRALRRAVRPGEAH